MLLFCYLSANGGAAAAVDVPAASIDTRCELIFDESLLNRPRWRLRWCVQVGSSLVKPEVNAGDIDLDAFLPFDQDLNVWKHQLARD